MMHTLHVQKVTEYLMTLVLCAMLTLCSLKSPFDDDLHSALTQHT